MSHSINNRALGEHMKTLSSNYIVRIYRRDRKCPLKVIGILEDVSTERIWRFNTIEELVNLFTGVPGKKPGTVVANAGQGRNEKT